MQPVIGFLCQKPQIDQYLKNLERILTNVIKNNSINLKILDPNNKFLNNAPKKVINDTKKRLEEAKKKLQ